MCHTGFYLCRVTELLSWVSAANGSYLVHSSLVVPLSVEITDSRDKRTVCSQIRSGTGDCLGVVRDTW